MDKLLKLMFQNYPLRAAEGADGADGGGANNNADFAAKLDALTAQVEKLLAGKKDADPAIGKDDVLGKVDKDIQADRLAQKHSQELEAAIKFNMSAKQFVEDKKAFLSERAGRIVSEIESKQFTTEIARAHNLQKNLLCDYLSEQENIDALPEALRGKAMEFKKLADDEKETRAADYWDVLTLGVDRKEVIKKAEEAQRANNGYASRGTYVADYEARVFALGNKEKK